MKKISKKTLFPPFFPSLLNYFFPKGKIKNLVIAKPLLRKKKLVLPKNYSYNSTFKIVVYINFIAILRARFLCILAKTKIVYHYFYKNFLPNLRL
ncbi:MAG: hypothetical protein QXO40_02330 [Candidatus Aenigmatarchaeota archaeon]